MCTVVFVPDTDKVFLASLRDESPLRPAISPEFYAAGGTTILCPRDTSAGGTWLGINDHKNVIILLNGGFEKHVRKDFYRKSRGLIVSELLESAMPVVDWELLNMQDIEPFTLIVWSDNHLFRLVWDGNQKHRIRLDSTMPHIFSSSTLYSPVAKAYREDLFQNWIAMDPPMTKLSLLRFFKSAPNSEDGFLMNRNEIVRTLSYSFIEMNHQGAAAFSYYDLQRFTYHHKTLELKTKASDCLVSD